VKECKRIPREPGKIDLKQNNGKFIKGKLHFQFKSDLMTAHGERVMLRLHSTCNSLNYNKSQSLSFIVKRLSAKISVKYENGLFTARNTAHNNTMRRGGVGGRNDYIQNSSSSRQVSVGRFSKRRTYHTNYNESIQVIFEIIHSRCVYSTKSAVHNVQPQHNHLYLREISYMFRLKYRAIIRLITEMKKAKPCRSEISNLTMKCYTIYTA